jgi:hypothetical protein
MGIIGLYDHLYRLKVAYNAVASCKKGPCALLHGSPHVITECDSCACSYNPSS